MRRRVCVSLIGIWCVLGLPALAKPASPPATQASETTSFIVTPTLLHFQAELLAYSPPEPADGADRSSRDAGESDEEEVPLIEETFVEDTFQDPFSTESEPVRDPWEPFNSTTFAFNYNLDRYALKPLAKVYSGILPPDVQNSLGNAFNNMGFPSRFLNGVLQGKGDRAVTELQRFLLNSTLGVAGLFDVATYMFDLEAPPKEDIGQTLASYGVDSGPYLVLPLFPPVTVRDAVGFVGDIFMNPFNYFIPVVPNAGLNAADRLNSRALNIERFEGIEASTIDLYGAARSSYFDRRARDIRE